MWKTNSEPDKSDDNKPLVETKSFVQVSEQIQRKVELLIRRAIW